MIIKFNSLPVYTTQENEDNRKLQTSIKKKSIIDNTNYTGKVPQKFNESSTQVNWVFHINMAFN